MRKYHKRRPRPLQLEHLEPRQLLAGDTYLVNFQNDEASPPTHYLRDTGQVFGVQSGGLSYGWSVDHTDQAFERSATADQRLDTLVRFKAGQKWEFALANGLYEVTVAVGDPANNDGVHSINVEGVNYWNAVADTASALVQTQQITVSDGRLSIDSGAAANFATRIDYVHIVGLANSPNASPAVPTITEPSVAGQIVNPADVHMEAVGYSDGDGNAHKSTDWEIWTVGGGALPVWQTLGIEGIEINHTHLGDGVFINAQAGQIQLAANTDYELRVRFRDDVGSVSNYATRTFHTGASSTIFPLNMEDILASPVPTWTDVFGAPVDLPTGGIGILSPGDAIIAIDTDAPTSASNYPTPNETPAKAIDGVANTKYLNFGKLNSGFIVTPGGSTTVKSIRIGTANDSEGRDPSSYELWGTNSAIVSADNSTGLAEPWTLISSGALTLPATRNFLTAAISFTNTTAYTSYKVIFPTVKNPGGVNSMQVGEVELYTGTAGTGTEILDAGDPIRAVQVNYASQSPATEGVANAIDQDANTKYLNFGEANSGFIVTPASGSSVVSRFQITTANDDDSRDPASWVLYGANSPITSAPNSQGNFESWALIDSGTLNLPNTRQTAGPEVAINNTTAYTSYKMVFPTVRDGAAANSMQIAGIQFFANPGPGAVIPSVQLEAGHTGEPLLTITGTTAAGNLVTDYPPLPENHAHLRVVIKAESAPLVLNASDLVVADEHGELHTIYLPAVNLAANGRLDLWVSLAGGTYYGTEAQMEPDFSSLARQPNLNIPYVTTQPGFVIEQVGSGYRLPVNIAFVPNPGPNPTDPLYYVTELYGSIQVVTRDGTKREFATGLLDYNPTGPISGSGEQGLTGITVQRDTVNPEIYHLYVGMLWDNGAPAGGATHYPKIERIDSLAGGLSLASRTVLLNMQPETQGQSHQISNFSIGPDGKLYVHVGDGFNTATALNLDQFRGKILRMNLDGTAPSDNPFYDNSNGINARDYIYAYGFRNPFGGAWRASDGKHYEVENGPSVDRLAQVNAGVSYGWNGSDASMATNATYNWATAHAPVNITFVQQATFNGSQFPASKMDHAFVSESGPTYASGPQSLGKQLTEFQLSAAGTSVLDGPDNLVQYVGTGHSSVVGLAAGPDGLYFTELYEDTGANGATASGARIYRVRYINPLQGDYDINGVVDQNDYTVWRSTIGSNLLLAADGNGNGVVDAADYVIWRKHLGQTLGSGAGASSALTSTPSTSSDSPPSTPISDTSVPAINSIAAPTSTPLGFSIARLDSATVMSAIAHTSVRWPGLEADHVFGNWQTRLFDNLLTYREQRAVAFLVSSSNGPCIGHEIDAEASDSDSVDSAFEHFIRHVTNKLRR